MSVSSTKLVSVCVALLLAGTVGACQSGSKKPATTAGAAPAVTVNPSALQAMAKTPPPANAMQRTSLGKGKASVNTANSPADTDSYWVGQLDIDGNGTLEETQFLWDDEDKVFYAYAETVAPCANGGTAGVAILAGVNCKGNTRGRPEGSGFYAVYFDAMECGAAAAGLYGCRFNAAGNVTAWGEALVDAANDEIIIAARK